MRRGVARRILDMSDEELDPSPYMDFGIKVVNSFRSDLEATASAGKCPVSLWVFMTLVRKELAADTQDVEGANSTLQRMANLAPHLKLAMASDRMWLKFGDSISAEDCAELNQDVLQHQSSSTYADRFIPITNAELQLVPAEPGPERADLGDLKQAACFALSLFREAGGSAKVTRTSVKGNAFVWEIHAAGSWHGFLAISSLVSTLMLVGGEVAFHADRDMHIFTIARPMCVSGL